jgi:hypothetical protein
MEYAPQAALSIFRAVRVEVATAFGGLAPSAGYAEHRCGGCALELLYLPSSGHTQEVCVMFRFLKGSRARSVRALDDRKSIRSRETLDERESSGSTAPAGSFGALLWHHRTSAHRTQQEFAKHAGISLDVLAALEDGQWAGDDKMVRRIAVALFLSQAQEKALTDAWETLRRPSILP